MTRNSADGTVNLAFIYDENGRPYSLERYNSSGIVLEKYHYITNVQGDVIRLIDENNAVIANYAYDAWGKLISITDAGGSAITASNHIAIRNPIRYRGYFYDEDTKLYYCNSRYYDPQTRRFINADSMVSTGQGFNGYNMFAYCGNNPVMCFDPSGYWSNLLGVANKIGNQAAIAKQRCTVNIELSVSRSQLVEMEFQDTSIQNVMKLNRTLDSNNIESNEQIAHFLSQCAVETSCSIYLTEGAWNPAYDQNYYDSNTPYGYKYRGAGYIQLTWEYNYKEFSNYMNDPNILYLGADYVASNYAWDAAGFWWTQNGMNSMIANGASVYDVTLAVNGGTTSLAEREKFYYKYLSIMQRP